MKEVYCCLCGHSSEEGIIAHLKHEHSMSVDAYLSEFSSAPVVSDELMHGLPVELLKPKHDIEPGRKKVIHKIGEWDIEGYSEPSHLTPRVDTSYKFPPETELLLNGIRHGDKCLLVGPTGCGKSQMVLQLAARANIPLIRFNLHGETSVSNFLGHWVVQGKEMEFLEGVLPTAMRKGSWLLLDELDSCTPQVSFLLHSVLEEKGCLVMADKDGEVVEPHPDFRIVATANTIGKGEDSGLYTGTQILNEAFLDRFGTVIRMDYLPFDEEVKVLIEKAPNLEPVIAAGLTTVASEIRKAFTEETVYCTFSTRRLVNWARKYTFLGDINKAAEIAILNRLSQDDRKVVEEVIQRYFG
jgi:cobaltochelatase CobS